MSTLNPSLSTTDPFAEVLESLKKSLQDTAMIDPIIDDAAEIVSTIDHVLKDVDDIPKILTGVTEILETLGTLINFLDAVPIVDVIAGICEGIIDAITEFMVDVNEIATTIDDEIVKPCLPIFNDINKGLTEAKKVVDTISVTVPDYLNTIAILSYMVDIAEPLVKVLEGTKSADDLNKFLGVLNTVRDDAAAVLKPVAEFLHLLDDALNKIKDALGGAFQDIKKVADTVMKGLNSIEGVFDPIVNAFNKIVDAIKPLKWVLEAAKCIFDTILKPVIDEILKITGIDALLNPLKEEIEKKLGIKPIQEAMQGKVTESSSSQWQSGSGANAASSGSQNWSSLTGILSKYSTRNPDGVKDDVFMLVSAVIGTPIDPSKPGIVPDWPDPPAVHGLSNNASNTFQASYNRVSRRTEIDKKVAALKTISHEVTNIPKLLLLSKALPEDTLQLSDAASSLKDLQALAQKEISDLATVQQTSQSLSNNLSNFEKAENLPSYYQAEISDFTQLFADVEKVIDFLLEFNVLKEILTDIEAPVQQMLTELQGMSGEITNLVNGGNQVDGQVKQLLAGYPNNASFKESMHFIDAVATGAKLLAALEDQANDLNTKLDGQFTTQINAMVVQIDAAATAVSNQITTLSTNTQNAIDEAATINSFLVKYANMFTTLAQNIAIVSNQAMPQLSKGVSTLNTITSILDPLSAIIKDLNCTAQTAAASGPNLKEEAGAMLSQFKDNMFADFSGKDALVKDAFAFLINKEVPVNTIESNISAINSYVSSQNIEKAIANMLSFIQNMTSEMQPKYSYNSTNKAGKTIEVKNVLVDQDFINKAQQLIKDMQAACKAKGIPFNN